MYVERNIEACSFNHRCGMKTGNIRYGDISNQQDAAKFVMLIVLSLLCILVIGKLNAQFLVL